MQPTSQPKSSRTTPLLVFVLLILAAGVALAVLKPGDLDDSADVSQPATTTTAKATTTTKPTSSSSTSNDSSDSSDSSWRERLRTVTGADAEADDADADDVIIELE